MGTEKSTSKIPISEERIWKKELPVALVASRLIQESGDWRAGREGRIS